MTANTNLNILQFLKVTLLVLLCLGSCSCKGQEPSDKDDPYEYKPGHPSGIDKWYMGRQIAHVMGYQGMPWLERNDREKEENTSLLLDNMCIKSTDTIADIGAGSGYHVFKMAKVASDGLIYAVDIQQEMLDAMREKLFTEEQDNIEFVKSTSIDTNLPENSVDKILMVDVYHEFSDPVAMLASMHEALREHGRIYLIEYRAEDPSVPIKPLHKMSEEQAVKEFEANGFTLLENIDNLPWQHCMVFVKL